MFGIEAFQAELSPIHAASDPAKGGGGARGTSLARLLC